MSAHLLIGDLQKAFLQIGIAEENRDEFRFPININNKEVHLRFARVHLEQKQVRSLREQYQGITLISTET